MRRCYKWLAFAVCFAAFILLGTETVPLTDRAVVVGIGIDKTETGYLVSAQIVLPAEADAKESGYIIAKAEDVSLSGALNAISREAGKIISMSHCNVVILGNEVIQHDAVNVLDYILRNAYLSENALLLATGGKAADILSAKTVYGDSSSLFIQNTLMKFGYYPVRGKRNIKEFVVSYCTEKSGNWLTSVSLIQTDAPVSGDGSADGAAYVFDYSETAIFSGSNYIMKLDEKGTRGINYVESVLEEGSLTVTLGGAVYNFFIVRSSCKKTFGRDMSARFDIKCELNLKEICSPSGVKADVSVIEPGEAVNLAVSQEIVSAVNYAFESCYAAGVDVFNLYDGFYGIYGAEWKEEYFRDVAVEVRTKLKFA